MQDSVDYEPDKSGVLDLKYGGRSVLEHRVLSFAHNLVVLDVSFNLLKELPNEISQLTNLQELSCSANKLSSLPESIGSIHSLRVIRANNNMLTILPSSIGQLKNLQQCIFNDNLLTSLSDSIGGCTSLSSLLLQNNALRRLPSSLAFLKGQLCELDISRNDEQIQIALPTRIHKDAESILWLLALQREKTCLIDNLKEDVRRLQYEIAFSEEALLKARQDMAVLEDRKNSLNDELQSVKFFLCVRDHYRQLRRKALELWQTIRGACATESWRL